MPKCFIMSVYSARGLEAACFELVPEGYEGSLEELANERYSLWLEKNLDDLEAFADTLEMEFAIDGCYEKL